jgi:hypothetical protein
MLEAGRGGRIARQIASAVMGFGEDDVVDIRRVDAGAPHHLGLTGVPLKDRPMSVLAAPTMTGVGMFRPRVWAGGRFRPTLQKQQIL